jgi:predicted nucleic acid-binding Zn finger protein
MRISPRGKEDALEEALRRIRELRTVPKEISDELSSLFGGRFRSALKAVEEGRVKKYVFKPSNRVLWIVVGRKRDYEVMPEAPFCSCHDFYFKVLEGEAPLCYHLLAQSLAEAMGKYEVFHEDDGLYERLMAEWREPEKGGRAAWLRYVDEVRDVAAKILLERSCTLRELYRELLALGFEIPSPRSLASALLLDPRKRFHSIGGRWEAIG